MLKNISKWSTPKKVLFSLLLLIIFIAIFTPKNTNNYLSAGFGMHGNLGNLKGDFNIETMQSKKVNCGNNSIEIPLKHIKNKCKDKNINCTHNIEPKYPTFKKCNNYYIDKNCLKKKHACKNIDYNVPRCPPPSSEHGPTPEQRPPPEQRPSPEQRFQEEMNIFPEE